MSETIRMNALKRGEASAMLAELDLFFEDHWADPHDLPEASSVEPVKACEVFLLLWLLDRHHARVIGYTDMLHRVLDLAGDDVTIKDFAQAWREIDVDFCE